MAEIKMSPLPKTPNLKGLIDDDILDRFEDAAVFYGDIINAQLIKTNKELLKELKRKSNGELIP